MWLTTSRVSAGFEPVYLVAGDWNGDGKTDLAASNGVVLVTLLGRGDGTFEPARNIPGPGRFGHLQTGDFNADGRVDAADYSVWRDGLGSTYTAADLAICKAHFGESLGSGSGSVGSASAVPEAADMPIFAIDAAREYIVTRFKAITDTSMHEEWGVVDGSDA